MPGQYKLKECPQCGANHRKKGAYCSQSCASKDRPVTEDHRRSLQQAANEYKVTPEGVALRQKLTRQQIARNKGLEFNEVTIEDFAVDIPTIQDENDLPPGYDHAEDW